MKGVGGMARDGEFAFPVETRGLTMRDFGEGHAAFFRWLDHESRRATREFFKQMAALQRRDRERMCRMRLRRFNEHVVAELEGRRL